MVRLGRYRLLCWSGAVVIGLSTASGCGSSSGQGQGGNASAGTAGQGGGGGGSSGGSSGNGATGGGGTEATGGNGGSSGGTSDAGGMSGAAGDDAGVAGSNAGGGGAGTGGSDASPGGTDAGADASGSGAAGSGGTAGVDAGSGGTAGVDAGSGGTAGVDAGSGGTASVDAGSGGTAGAGDAEGGNVHTSPPNWVIYDQSSAASLSAVPIYSDGSFDTPVTLASGHSQYIYPDSGPLWSPDASVLAVNGSKLDLYDMQNPTPVLLDAVSSVGGYTGCVSWSHDGSKLVYWDTDSNFNPTTRVYDRASKQSVKLASDQLSGVAWSPDDKWVTWQDSNTSSCQIANAATGVAMTVNPPSPYSYATSCTWASDGSFLLMGVSNSAVVVPFSSGTVGTPVDVGELTVLSPTDNLAVIMQSSGALRLAKLSVTGVGSTATLYTPSGSAAYSVDWNSTGTRVMLTALGEPPVLVDATSWPPGVTVGTAFPGGGGSTSYGWPVPRWFGYIQDANLFVVDGAITSAVTSYQLANDISVNSNGWQFGYYQLSDDGTGILMQPATQGIFDPPNPFRFADLSGTAPGAVVDLPSTNARILSRNGVRYVVYQDSTDQGLYARKIEANGSLASAAVLTGTLTPVDGIAVQP